jgi:hypothetical protein
VTRDEPELKVGALASRRVDRFLCAFTGFSQLGNGDVTQRPGTADTVIAQGRPVRLSTDRAGASPAMDTEKGVG